MSARKTERLLNLVIALLATRQPLTAEQIRAAVPGYADEPEAFKRMFERDKAELRDLGVPLETSETWDDESGYRIRRSDYELPELSLEPDEVAAVGLAARVWQSATLGDAAGSALRKLAAGGVAFDAGLPEGLVPRVAPDEPTLAALYDAMRAGTPVVFDYRTPGAPAPGRRRLEPWGVVFRSGRWYVAGHDRDRAAPRAFRLSRIIGKVTPDGPPGSVTVPDRPDLAALVATAAPPPGAPRTARVLVRPGRGGDLRREAVRSSAGPAGWDVVELPLDDVDPFADRLSGYGPDVLAESPPDLVAAVRARLARLAGGGP